MANERPPSPVLDGQEDLEEMWKALLESDWNSLGIVPADHNVSVQAVVDAYLRVAGRSSANVRLVDGRGLEIAEAEVLVRQLVGAVAAGERALVLVDSLMRSLSGVRLVEKVDAVVLAARVGAIDLEALASTVAIIGPDRVLGTVTAPGAA